MKKGYRHTEEAKAKIGRPMKGSSAYHSKKRAICHPDKVQKAHGFCSVCYNKKWRCGPGRASQERYQRSAQRRVANRRMCHGFTEADEKRFMAIAECDWCGFPFKGDTPTIDHDHACCPTNKHCSMCTRGFVHDRCNILAIAHHEWIEKEFGLTDPKLADYRMRFPRRLPFK